MYAYTQIIWWEVGSIVLLSVLNQFDYAAVKLAQSAYRLVKKETIWNEEC